MEDREPRPLGGMAISCELVHAGGRRRTGSGSDGGCLERTHDCWIPFVHTRRRPQLGRMRIDIDHLSGLAESETINGY